MNPDVVERGAGVVHVLDTEAAGAARYRGFDDHPLPDRNGGDLRAASGYHSRRIDAHHMGKGEVRLVGPARHRESILVVDSHRPDPDQHLGRPPVRVRAVRIHDVVRPADSMSAIARMALGVFTGLPGVGVSSDARVP